MTTQFSDFLAAHAARIADLWAKQGEPGGHTTGGSGGTRSATQFVNAVLVALSADDPRPLMAFHRLDAAGDVEHRLEAALRQLSALRRATSLAAREERLDAERALTLASAAADDIDAVGRRLAVGCIGRVERKLSTATTVSSARGTSLSITMHELRRPLTILNSYGQLLSTGMLGELPETASVAIEGITASTEMMVRMVNALAELARLDDPEDHLAIELVPASEVVDGAVEHVAMEAKLRESTIQSTSDPTLSVKGDRRRLILALTNLLGNAVKHGPPGSPIEVNAHRAGDSVCFVVRDHGTGFPPEDAAHLFDKYFRSVGERQRKVPGSGLGLYIVRTVVERHGGSVAARTLPGNGAEFEMVIPLHEEAR